MDSNFDFNGIFPGSNGQPPASAVDYLTPGVSPITSLLNAGTAAYNTSTFGIRNTTTGQVISVNDPAALNALNGNGLLEETVLNHQTIRTKEFGSDFGVKINTTGGVFDNSLTIGGMYYNVNTYSNQSAVASVINGVSNNSSIYDVVALNSRNQVVGQLTNNGMISYGDWGQGIYQDQLESYSAYFNDELKIGDNLHIDGGMRWEHEHDDAQVGNSYAVNPAVPAGTPGLIPTLGSSFNGTFTPYVASYNDLAGTIGVNYTLTRNVALYARYSKGFQTYGGDTGGTHAPANLTLYEAGVRYQSHALSGSLVAFRTQFRNQYYSFTDPQNLIQPVTAQADDNINGVQLDANWKPVHFFELSVSGVYQDPKLQNLRFSGISQPQYDGNTPAQSPKELLTVTPAFILPHGLGEIYGRYKYIGKIYADPGDGVALPSYGVFTVGASVNVTRRINLNVSVDNLTNSYGWTEGNPRQGQTQSVVDGIFYGRSIVGRNALASVTVKL
jgi:iron complex outermembrane receptor protein